LTRRPNFSRFSGAMQKDWMIQIRQVSPEIQLDAQKG
jgi:hypothetical protein